MVGRAGSGGYSASGMVARWKLLRRQVRVTLLPSVSMSTGADGRLRQMSASRRPETRMVPSVVMSAGISSRGGGLVVEARKADGTGFSLEEQAGKYGYWRPRRQRPGGPGHGFCQDVPFDSELHGRVPPFIAAVMLNRKFRSGVPKGVPPPGPHGPAGNHKRCPGRTHCRQLSRKKCDSPIPGLHPCGSAGPPVPVAAGPERSWAVCGGRNEIVI